jgi:hypothetical protein
MSRLSFTLTISLLLILLTALLKYTRFSLFTFSFFVSGLENRN